MAQDIRKIIKNHKPEPSELPKEHKARFEAKLEKAFSETVSKEKRTAIPWLKIAAMIVVLVSVGFFGYQQLSEHNAVIDGATHNSIVDTSNEQTDTNGRPILTLADISPDLKKIEDYYTVGINIQLASLTITDENSELVKGYMERLAELDNEYATLNLELNKMGPSEATIAPLIDNLKMRLDLLLKLKNKLNELNTQHNEEFKVI